MQYLSHPNQKLTEHIKNISNFDENQNFKTLAKFHDLAKVSNAFQNYIKSDNKKTKTTHANSSAFIYLFNSIDDSLELEKDKNIIFIFLSIISHHGKLKNFNGKLENRDDLKDFQNLEPIEQQIDEIYSKNDVVEFFNLKEIDITKFRRIKRKARNIKFSIEDFIHQKHLFSSLIFADKYEAIFKATPPKAKNSFEIENLNSYLKKLKSDKTRETIKRDILENYQKNDSNIYTITAPTGVGKTLISLELALNIYKEKKLNRVIYSIPFTSIIDQTYQIFNSIFPNKVTKHHHKIEYDGKYKSERDTEIDNIEEDNFHRWRFLLNSWSDNFIISTFYQLFFAIFSNENIDNIKLQALRDSVIILDETQAIPFELWKGLKEILPILAKELNITFILMSATMPIITKNHIELTKNRKSLFQSKNRYKLSYLNIDKNLEILEQTIVKESKSKKSILIVVNTIKTAKKLYNSLKEKIDNCYCLNSYILPKDRETVLKELTESNSNLVKNKILISTQLIEAGVDLDFDIGFREFAPIHSIIQTAGRVNREDRGKISDIYIFDEIFNPYDDGFMNESQKILLNELKENEIFEKNIFEFIEKFFQKIDNNIGDSNLLNMIENFNFDEISNINKKAFNFENNYIESVAIGIDLKALELEYFEATKEIKKPFEKRRIKEQFYNRVKNEIVNIKANDLDRDLTKYSKTFGLIYYMPDDKNQVYSKESGFLLDFEKEQTLFL